MHNTIHNTQHTLYNIQCTKSYRIVTVINIIQHSTVHYNTKQDNTIPHNTNIQYTMYNKQDTTHNNQSTIYNVQCRTHNIHYTILNMRYNPTQHNTI